MPDIVFSGVLKKGTTMKYLTIVDNERREPMGLKDSERCRTCGGPVIRTDASGLCWSCMPTSLAS